MHEGEILPEIEEVIVFKNNREDQTQIDEIKNIMDISGTSHEKLVKLAEML